MSDDPLGEALAATGSARIPQPALRKLDPQERYVRTAGLKFIIPENFKPGDVLDEQTAAMLNTAYTTLVINRFSVTRQTLLENPNCTYADLDKALQDHFDNFKYTPRPTRAPGEDEGLSDEDRDLLTFARPHFNKAYGGKGLERKDYEALLRTWVTSNREMLAEMKSKADAAFESLTKDLSGAFGED